MTIRPDNRLADAPMVPVSCHRCGAKVLARKSSWEQTSVQWDAAGQALCEQRRAAATLSGHAGRWVFLGCSEMTDSISAAAGRGAVPLLDEE